MVHLRELWEILRGRGSLTPDESGVIEIIEGPFPIRVQDTDKASSISSKTEKTKGFSPSPYSHRYKQSATVMVTGRAMSHRKGKGFQEAAKRQYTEDNK